MANKEWTDTNNMCHVAVNDLYVSVIGQGAKQNEGVNGQKKLSNDNYEMNEVYSEVGRSYDQPGKQCGENSIDCPALPPGRNMMPHIQKDEVDHRCEEGTMFVQARKQCGGNSTSGPALPPGCNTMPHIQIDKVDNRYVEICGRLISLRVCVLLLVGIIVAICALTGCGIYWIGTDSSHGKI